MDQIEQVETIEENVHVFSLPNDYRVCIEEYDDAEGGYVAAGDEFVSEYELEKIQDMLGFNVDRQ